SIYMRDGQWYMVGRDHDREDIRTFRLGRIRSDVRFHTRRERDFRTPASFDATAWRDRAAWQLGEPVSTATIWVSPEGGWMVERLVGHHGELAWQDDRSLVLPRSTPTCGGSPAGSSSWTAGRPRSSPTSWSTSWPAASSASPLRTRARR